MMELYFGTFGDKLPPFYNTGANINKVAESLRKISPDSAQYHTVNSLVKYGDWKFEDAIAEANLAEKADPNLVRAHGLHGWYLLLAHGDTAGSLREYRIAEKLAPSDVIVQMNLGDPYYVEKKFDAAIRQFTKALELEPRTTLPHFYLARAYEASQQYDKSLDEYEQFDQLSSADPEKVKPRYEKLRIALRENGPRGIWETRLADARNDPSAGPCYVAALHARLGHTDEAIEFLNRAYKEHDEGLAHLLEEDSWDSLRNDPRFKALLSKIGLHPVAK